MTPCNGIITCIWTLPINRHWLIQGAAWGHAPQTCCEFFLFCMKHILWQISQLLALRKRKKSFQLQGLHSPDHRVCHWNPLVALPPNPHYGFTLFPHLVVPNSYSASDSVNSIVQYCYMAVVTNQFATIHHSVRQPWAAAKLREGQK